MQRSFQTRRRHPRIRLLITAEVSCASVGKFRQPAYLHDVSAGGAFVYAELHPSLGMIIRVDFTIPVMGNDSQLSCEGSVVRVEPLAIGQQVGFAIEFAGANLAAW
ncbi:MAG: PilZ domain-containing protein [Terriglobales bacterium]